jgi:RNA polymerase sigma factor (sigma-70 family)
MRTPNAAVEQGFHGNQGSPRHNAARAGRAPGAGLLPCDIEELYGGLAGRLERMVRAGVRAPEPVIEDACQFAWGRLLHHREHVEPEAALVWLAKTAVHEAFKLARRDSRELSLDDPDRAPREAVAAPTPHELIERRERLAQVRHLPERQQRLVWLHAFGFSYVEMARHEGYTRRTVERQLLRAKHRMRALEAG